jgi:four helix bundle protein
VSQAPHESLFAYKRAREAVRSLLQVSDALPPRRGDLRDQIDRASFSILLNLAEGAAEIRKAEKARFYRMSRRSAAECLAALDIVEMLGMQLPAIVTARTTLNEVIVLTTLLIGAVDARK